ncbi:MAG: NirD/YgiW/YdeI family stress tolerance protein [Treponema sp.]|jgi:uncharacterized protein (TIGR00156 family)|nr:NirD/YgiW/YdeI family stress tolerance protein [Treponema sp.]
MKNDNFFYFIILFLLFTTAFVHGQGFTGPGTNIQPVMVSQPVTINEAKNYPHDSWVVITGNIVSVLPGGRHFIFRDSSGEIPVEIGPKEWRGLSAATSDTAENRVEICGEVKIERGQIFIKVHAITAAAGPNAKRYAVTINEAQNLPHDSWVVLNGNIVYSLPKPNDYTFRDSSGEITIDIGPKEWRGLSVETSDRVEISGEVKRERGQVFIKVHTIRKI